MSHRGRRHAPILSLPCTMNSALQGLLAQESDQVLINGFRAQRVQHGKRLGAVIGAVLDEVKSMVGT